MTNFTCFATVYKYKGWLFERGPMWYWPLKKNLEARARAGRKFYSILQEFVNLPENEQETYRISKGGCVEF